MTNEMEITTLKIKHGWYAVLTRHCDEPCCECPPCRLFFDIKDTTTHAVEMVSLLPFLSEDSDCDGLEVQIKAGDY